jgi:hypothetical protein
VIADRSFDCSGEFAIAAERASPNSPVGDFGKPAVDLVAPGRPARREVDAVERMVGELLLDSRLFAGAIVSRGYGAQEKASVILQE